MIITRTPFRVSLLGGGTDYPSWSRKHGGLVVGGTINHYAYLTVRKLPPFHEYKTRVVYSSIESVNKHLEIQHRGVRATLAYLSMGDDEAEGLEIFHAADLPGRSGTGSSSTFVVGLLNALSALQGDYMSPEELANAAIRIEQENLGETVGCQDQTWAAHGGLNRIHFRENGEIHVYSLGLPSEKVAALEAHLMLFFTGISRTSSEVAATYASTLGDRTREQWAMMRFAEEGVRAILDGNHEKLGGLIDQSWRLKTSLSASVSTPEVNGLYNAARVCGAFGGKLTGAGGGGCLLLVVPPEKQLKVSSVLQERGALHIPFRFEFEGSQVIFSQREKR